MKKYFNLLCILLTLSLFMTACSTSKMKESSAQENILNISRQEAIQKLDERLESHDYNTITNSAHSQIEQQIDGRLYKCDLYVFSPGMSIYFISDVKSDGLVQFTFKANEELISVPAFRLFGYMKFSLPGIFEPLNYEDLYQELEMESTSDTIEATTTKESRQYYYNKNGKVTSFSMTVPKADIIDVAIINFEKGEHTPEKVDFTIDSFIEKHDAVIKESGFNLLSNMEPTQVSDDELVQNPEKTITKGVYYDVAPGLRMYLYESKSGRLEGVDYYFVFSDAVDNTVKYLGNSFAITTHIFDDTSAEQIMDDLEIGNFTKSNRISSGSRMKYYYDVSDESLVFLISRISPVVTIDTVNIGK